MWPGAGRKGAVMAKQTQSTNLILKYYRSKPGQIIHYTDAADELHIDEAGANAALSRVVANHPEDGFRRVGSGQYIFRPNLVMEEMQDPPQKTTPTMLEMVGNTKGGKIVVRDENGTLYTLGEEI